VTEHLPFTVLVVGRTNPSMEWQPKSKRAQNRERWDETTPIRQQGMSAPPQWGLGLLDGS